MSLLHRTVHSFAARASARHLTAAGRGRFPWASGAGRVTTDLKVPVKCTASIRAAFVPGSVRDKGPGPSHRPSCCLVHWLRN